MLRYATLRCATLHYATLRGQLPSESRRVVNYGPMNQTTERFLDDRHRYGEADEARLMEVNYKTVSFVFYSF